EIGVAPDVDGLLRARFHARIALPTEVGFDVVGAPIDRIDVHDVGGAEIDALAAAVASRHVGVGRHGELPSNVAVPGGPGKVGRPVRLFQPPLKRDHRLVEHVGKLGPRYGNEKKRREENVDAEQYEGCSRADTLRLREVPDESEGHAGKQGTDKQVWLQKP